MVCEGIFILSMGLFSSWMADPQETADGSKYTDRGEWLDCLAGDARSSGVRHLMAAGLNWSAPITNNGDFNNIKKKKESYCGINSLTRALKGGMPETLAVILWLTTWRATCLPSFNIKCSPILVGLKGRKYRIKHEHCCFLKLFFFYKLSL